MYAIGMMYKTVKLAVLLLPIIATPACAGHLHRNDHHHARDEYVQGFSHSGVRQNQEEWLRRYQANKRSAERARRHYEYHTKGPVSIDLWNGYRPKIDLRFHE